MTQARCRGAGVVLMIAVVCALVAPAGAGAAAGADIRGTWSCVSTAGGTCTFAIKTLDMGAGTFSGRGEGNGFTWPVTGKLDGLQLTMTHGPFDQLAYTATYDGTVSADGSSMSGTYDDGRGPTPFTYTRTTGPGSDPGPNPNPAPPAPDAPQPADRPRSTVRVMCNRASQPDAVFTCTATVGGSSGGRATGTVRWTATTGLFTAGDTCVLTAGTFSGNTSYCTVQYAVSGLGTGVAPPVTATYGGDALNGPGSGSPGLLGAPVDFDRPAPLCLLTSNCRSGVDVSGAALRSLSETEALELLVGCYAEPRARASQAGRRLDGCGVTVEAALTDLEALRKAAAKGLESTRKEDQLKAQLELQRLNRELARLQEIEATRRRADELLRSSRKADQLKAQQLLQQSQRELDRIGSSRRAQADAVKTARAAAVTPKRERAGLQVARSTGRIAGGTRQLLRLAVPQRRAFVLRALRTAGVKRVRVRIRVAVARNGDRRATVAERTIRVALR